MLLKFMLCDRQVHVEPFRLGLAENALFSMKVYQYIMKYPEESLGNLGRMQVAENSATLIAAKALITKRSISDCSALSNCGMTVSLVGS